MLTRTGRAWQISVLAACGIVLTAVLAGTGVSLRLAAAVGLVLLALLWATAHVVTDLELAYPVTRRGRLRAAAARSEPLLAFTGAALAARNAAGRAWHTAHTGEADRHQKARSDLALALTALDEELPRVQGLGLPKATEAANRLNTELHALGAGCTLSALQNDQDRLAAQSVIGTHLDVLLDLTEEAQSIRP
ncbi:hypothetical protein [Streptomyces sp. NPDC057386]|uniref:hypothetical protein n=1 Tax=unclassified Streptomyces TaxID=2593676 RepID=UPI003640E16D